MQIDSSASRTGSESASAVEWAITVRMPISRHVRITRSAISPRLAMRILWNTGRLRPGIDEEQGLAELDGLAVLHQHRVMRPATLASISFMSFMASMMHRTWPSLTTSPSCTKGAASGAGAR